MICASEKKTLIDFSSEKMKNSSNYICNYFTSESIFDPMRYTGIIDASVVKATRIITKHVFLEYILCKCILKKHV